MTRIIEELFFGNIRPNEGSFARGSRYDKALQVVSGNEEKLLRSLSGEELEMFTAYCNGQSEINGITALENFTNGFRLGARIGAEIADEDYASP